MSRYADHSQEILYRDGKLVGFNAGYGFHAEHEFGYKGMEQMQPKKKLWKKDRQPNPFSEETVRNPDSVYLMELNDGGTVLLTNDDLIYYRMLEMSEEDRSRRVESLINNDDRKSTDDFLAKLGIEPEQPEVVALWDGGHFNLISTNEHSSELLKTLYVEMQKENVAISSDYSFLFKDRGLSFVLLDQLSKEDFLTKQLVDHRGEMARQFEREYNEFLKEEGLEGLFGGSKYPIEFWNVQIHDLLQKKNGEIMPQFYLELIDTSKDRENLDANTMFNLPRYMTGAEIKFLVPIVQTPEYEEFAKSHSKEEIGEYLNSKVEEYHEQQKIAEEQGYQITEDSLTAIATEQRTETVEKRKLSLKNRISKWLHPDREKTTEEKGE